MDNSHSHFSKGGRPPATPYSTYVQYWGWWAAAVALILGTILVSPVGTALTSSVIFGTSSGAAKAIVTDASGNVQATLASGVVAVANGGTGAATSTAFTAFGNFTNATAAPGFGRKVPVVLQTLYDGVTANTGTQNQYQCITLTSIPANTLSTNGDEVRVDFLGHTSGTDSVQFFLQLGSTACGTGGFTGGTSYFGNTATAATNGGFEGHSTIFRTGNSTQAGRGMGVGTTSLVQTNFATSSITDTSAMTLVLAIRDTSAAPAANALVFDRAMVTFFPAS